uniref:Uncharacterized protein n=1 Tax=Branchiostoma floridae TaxID=7739 RepID=C3Z156_BRAFL|eukprot:XP_002597743.1 hypothetical protein BRAFLDRAFT_77354 [Branchiostoma floridae]
MKGIPLPKLCKPLQGTTGEIYTGKHPDVTDFHCLAPSCEPRTGLFYRRKWKREGEENGELQVWRSQDSEPWTQTPRSRRRNVLNSSSDSEMTGEDEEDVKLCWITQRAMSYPIPQLPEGFHSGQTSLYLEHLIKPMDSSSAKRIRPSCSKQQSTTLMLRGMSDRSSMSYPSDGRDACQFAAASNGIVKANSSQQTKWTNSAIWSGKARRLPTVPTPMMSLRVVPPYQTRPTLGSGKCPFQIHPLPLKGQRFGHNAYNFDAKMIVSIFNEVGVGISYNEFRCITLDTAFHPFGILRAKTASTQVQTSNIPLQLQTTGPSTQCQPPDTCSNLRLVTEHFIYKAPSNHGGLHEPKVLLLCLSYHGEVEASILQRAENTKRITGTLPMPVWLSIWNDWNHEVFLYGLLGDDQRRALFKLCDIIGAITHPVVKKEKILVIQVAIDECLVLVERGYPCDVMRLKDSNKDSRRRQGPRWLSRTQRPHKHSRKLRQELEYSRRTSNHRLFAHMQETRREVYRLKTIPMAGVRQSINSYGRDLSTKMVHAQTILTIFDTAEPGDFQALIVSYVYTRDVEQASIKDMAAKWRKAQAPSARTPHPSRQPWRNCKKTTHVQGKDVGLSA